MVTRILGTAVGVLLLLYVLLLRGLPVLFFIKMLPLIFLIMVAAALIYAGVTYD